MGIFGKNKVKKENQDAEAMHINDKEELATETNQEKEQEVAMVEGDFAFLIQESFPLKDSGCIVAGLVLLGTVKTGQMVLNSDGEGNIACESIITEIKQAKEVLEQASADNDGKYGAYYSFMLPNTETSTIKKGNVLISPSMLLNDRLKEIPDLFRAAKKAHLPEYKISDDKKNEIIPILLQSEVRSDMLETLSIQEVIFLICSLRAMNDQSPVENFESKQKTCIDDVIDKLMNAPSLYMTFDTATRFPFINAGRVDIYSKKEFAVEATEYFKQQYRNLEIKEIKKDNTGFPDNMNVFAYLYFLGMENVIIDNGQYKIELKRSEILPPPDFANAKPSMIPILNPQLRFAMLDFFAELKWRVNYQERPQVVQEKESAMLQAICKARFLAPMKHDGEVEKVEDGIRFKKGGKMMFAKIVSEDNIAFIPVFTDWLEFEKVYNRNEWNGAIISIMEAINIGQGDGIAINPYGENILLNDKNIAAIQEEYEKLRQNQ